VVGGVREIFAAGEAATAAAAGPAAGAPRARSGRVLLIAAAVLLVAAAGLLLALVPVPLKLQPEGASVDTAGPFHWRAGDRLFVLPGERALNITHPGYRSRSLTLQVSRDLVDAEPLVVELARLPGTLAVDTGGVAAELVVDGQVVAQLPGEVEIEAGTHALTVRAPRHVDYTALLDIEGGGERQALTVQLQPAIGWLAFDTTPANASVRIDGVDRGTAPLRVELDAGLRQVSISAPGRRRWTSDIAIVAGQTLDLGRIDLAAPPPPPVAAAPAPASADVAASAATVETAPAPAPPPAPRLTSAVGPLILLPAGKYVQGSDRREQGRRSNESQREVTLSRAFYLAENEVTNAQFRAFKPEHVSGLAREKSLDLDSQAVTSVSWDDAVEFCNWLSLRESLPLAYERRDGRWQLVEPNNRGYRLPTEAEWEYAARFVDGRSWQRYPWGNQLPPPAAAANLGGGESLPTRPGPDVRLATSLPDYRDEHVVVAPVGAYARSAAGFHDLGGNVSEWMHDVYVSLPDNRPVTDPMGASSNGPHVMRGANWQTTSIAELRPAWREQAASASQVLGFRVARYAEDPS
jgi:formylglycine-generating enzyme required for sulfatase activity